MSLRDGRMRSFVLHDTIAHGYGGIIYSVTEKGAFSCELLVLKHITTSAKKNRDEEKEHATKIDLTYGALVKLEHENIVKYYDYGKSDNKKRKKTSWYSLQEFLPGK